MQEIMWYPRRCGKTIRQLELTKTKLSSKQKKKLLITYMTEVRYDS